MKTDAKRPTGWRRALRIVRRIVYVVLAIAVVAVATTLIVIHTSWGRDQIRGVIESELRSSFPGGAKVGALEGSVLGDFTLRDVELDALDGKPAIKIKTIHANIALRKLLSKTAELETLQIRDLEVTLGGGPLTRPADPKKPGSQPSAWTVSLPEIVLTRGTIEVVGGKPLHIDDIDLAGGLELPGGQPLTASVMIRGTWRETKAPINLVTSVAVGDMARIPSLQISVGDVHLIGNDLAIDGQQPIGDIDVNATAAAIEALFPEVVLPAEARLAIGLTRAGKGTQVAIDGTVGESRVHGSIRGDIGARTAAGYIGASSLDIAPFVPSTIKLPEHLRGEVALAMTVSRDGAHGVVGVHGSTLDLPASDATILIDSTWHDATVTMLASSAGAARVAAVAHGTRAKGTKVIAVDRARVVAVGRDLGAASSDRLPLSGSALGVDVRLEKPGTLQPVVSLSFIGTARGAGIHYNDLQVAGADSTFRGTFDTKLLARGRASVTGASRKGLPLGRASADFEYLADGRIWTRVDAHPAMVTVGLVASAYITLPTETSDLTKIALTDHVISPPTGAPWIGRGGLVTIGKDSTAIRDFVTTNGPGKARVNATIAGTSIDATVDATQLPMVALDSTFKGTVSGKLAIKGRGGRWDGGGDFTGTAMSFTPDRPTLFDGTAHLALAGRSVKLDTHITSPNIGAVRLELDVDGPRDITDINAWRHLERTAMRDATITIDKVMLDELSPTGGLVDGKLVVGATTASGTVMVQNVVTPVGAVEGTVTFSPAGKDLQARWNALLSEVGEANVNVRLAFPRYPFDPLSWKQLGPGILQSMTATFDDLAIDPSKLEKLGVTAKYSARADAKLSVSAGATSATVDLDLRSIEGDLLARPIDAHVHAATDGSGTTADACVARTRDPRGDACAKHGLSSVSTAVRLLEVSDASVPVTFSTWINAKRALPAILATPITGKVVVPSQRAPDYLALIGRTDFDPKKGTIEGSVAIAGTLGKPTGKGKFSIQKLQVLTDIAGRAIPELTDMKVVAGWDGVGGTVDLTTNESNGGTLHASAGGQPEHWVAATGKLEAVTFDLSPLAAFLPGELRAASGMLAGTVTVNGFDLSTSRIEADLHLTKFSIPIHPIVGTLRDATMNVRMSDTGMKLDARGLLNSCRDPEKPRCTENVWLDMTAPTDLTKFDGNVFANKVSTIGEIEPIIDGTAKLDLRRTGRVVTGDIIIRNCARNDDKHCRNGYIQVPVSTGSDLLAFENPDDLYFIENPPKQTRFGEGRVPTKAWLDANIYLQSTRVEVVQFGAKASIIAKQPLHLLVGDEVGLDGKISIEYGNIDELNGRQYQIEPNDLVTFDGTIDPVIDLQIHHQFPEMKLTVIVQGRLSDPEFPHPIFAHDQKNVTYEQGDLLLFFAGADPSGAAGAQTKDAATGAGYSVASQLIAKKLKQYLPGKLKLPDVIKCEPGNSAGSGTSCTVGYRLLHDRAYITLKHRLTPLPSENGDEVNFQYYLSQEWFVEGAGGDANIVGADLLWHRRW